ncbi:MAG: hypothetical protein ACPHXS_06555, partial [Flavobacteriaceae bacterium]
MYSTNTTITDDLSYDNVTVDSGVTLTIEKSGSLNISGTLTNNGAIVMNSASNEYSSLIAGSKAGSGTYTYNKFISPIATNDLIAAPFSGQSFTDLIAQNPKGIYVNSSDNTQYLFGPFDNILGEYLTYYSTTNYSTILSAGKGYRVGSGKTSADFSSGYNVTNFNLTSHNDWTAAEHWKVDTNSQHTYIDDPNTFKRAIFLTPVTGLSEGDKVTIKANLFFTGNLNDLNKALIRFGFTTASTWWDSSSTLENVINLSTSAYETRLQLRNNDNGSAISPNAFLEIEDVNGSGVTDNLSVEISLTIGADAATSTMSGKIINVTDGNESSLGSYTGVVQSLYDGATISTIYPLMTSQTFNSNDNGDQITRITVTGFSVFANDESLSFQGTFNTSNVT